MKRSFLSTSVFAVAISLIALFACNTALDVNELLQSEKCSNDTCSQTSIVGKAAQTTYFVKVIASIIR